MLTFEQRVVVESFMGGDNHVVTALAGSGKTTTLVACAQRVRGSRGLYVTYSRALADEMRQKTATLDLPVKAATAHSLAWLDTPAEFRRRATSPGRMRYSQVAKELGLTRSIQVTDTRRLTPSTLAVEARKVTTAMRLDGVDEPSKEHLGRWAGTEAEGPLSDAAIMWSDDLADPEGTLPYSHDDYLAAWAASEPDLASRCGVGYMMLDEAQDADPAIARVTLGQKGLPTIVVGDPYQAIYGWRGAVDAMDSMDGHTFSLTGSFRFGQGIADVGNQALEAMGCPIRMRGLGTTGEHRVSGRLSDATMVITRTNAGAVGALMEADSRGIEAHISSGARNIENLVKGGCQLRNGHHTEVREYYGFRTWDEVVAYAHEDPDPGDLGMVVSLAERYGLEKVARVLERNSSKGMEITTAHRSKGRAGRNVLMWEDWRSIDDPSGAGREQAMAFYVALTRATHVLDTGRIKGGVAGVLTPAPEEDE